MALTQEKIVDKVEVLPNDFHFIQIREKTAVKDGDEIIAEKYYRRVLVPGYKDSDGNYVKTDVSGETNAVILSNIENHWTGVNDQEYAEHIGATWIDS